MRKPISFSVRKELISKYEAGISISKLSREYGVSRRSIYILLERYQTEGVKGIHPKYKHCGKKRPTSQDFLYRAVRCFRTWHPSWGAEKIHAELIQLRPSLLQALPHHRTFYRWFHWNNQVDLKTKLPNAPTKRSKQLHEGWQIDAKECMHLQNGEQVCWLNIVDEYSTTVIDPIVFSLQ